RSSGYRPSWWEDAYEKMANELGRDATKGEQIHFDIADPSFVNAYFSVLHKPYEEDGVAFWWIDWQQGFNTKIEGLDPLWSLNHYHYLDNAKSGNGLILSRYAGVGSHRYPLGFSGDTLITWATLDYLPYFTATASNVGYTWWSHDIGGHMMGEKNDELYVRHLQFGVFSPINRLHSTNSVVCTKEPWAYGNGAGEIAKKWLRFRHQLIPYLYTAAYRAREFGEALIEPLYYEWKTPQAYKFVNEYLFGGQMLVLPITEAAKKDKFARVKGWLPQGVWTDIFTGAEYEVTEKSGKCVTFLRDLDSIPALIKSGGILPLSLDKGNGAKNPERLEICVYEGNGEYRMYEDGAEVGGAGVLFTELKTQNFEKDGKRVQKITLKAVGDGAVAPKNRTAIISFKGLTDGEISLFVDGEKTCINHCSVDCVACSIAVETGKEYCVEATYPARTKLQKLLSYAKSVLLRAEWGNSVKNKFWKSISNVKSVEEYVKTIDGEELPFVLKQRLKETL
ncbi:MAG: alpha-xylosidase, partial [Clostridia bacterium]|nr:alpha-xylosidase [Clostridia bacterium]